MNDAWALALLGIAIGALPSIFVSIQNRKLRKAQVKREEAETGRAYTAMTALLSQAASNLVSSLSEEVERQNARIDELEAEMHGNREAMVCQQVEMTTLREMLDKALNRIDVLEAENCQLREDNHRLRVILDRLDA